MVNYNKYALTIYFNLDRTIFSNSIMYKLIYTLATRDGCLLYIFFSKITIINFFK